jgi:hypothetical protein
MNSHLDGPDAATLLRFPSRLEKSDSDVNRVLPESSRSRELDGISARQYAACELSEAGGERMLAWQARLMVNRAERANAIDDQVIARLEADLRSALRRKPAQEPRLAGVLRALAPKSARLCEAVVDAFELMVRRASFDRPLYAATARATAELPARRAGAAFKVALTADGLGTLATLSALCASSDPGLADVLSKVARSRHAHLAFAAEIARMARGESSGLHLESIAPKIKESHRIALCAELFVPLTWSKPMGASVGPALALLRDAERHLGRWLVLGEVATRAGDRGPIVEARRRAAEGPQSSRAAWAMVAWALSYDLPAPTVRPTTELVARLSDRPSVDRDTTFLFRLARKKVPAARPMLEIVATGPLCDESAVRAALHLARDYGDRRSLDLLRAAACSPKREALRGLAAAALFDSGEVELALKMAEPLLRSRALTSVAWAALVRSAGLEKNAELVLERTVRRIQFGRSE